MFATLIDMLLPKAVMGAKTEITGATLAIINGVNLILCHMGTVCWSTDTINNINTILATLMGIFLAQRVSRVEKAATVAATAPVTIINNPPSVNTPIAGVGGVTNHGFPALDPFGPDANGG